MRRACLDLHAPRSDNGPDYWRLAPKNGQIGVAATRRQSPITPLYLEGAQQTQAFLFQVPWMVGSAGVLGGDETYLAAIITELQPELSTSITLRELDGPHTCFCYVGPTG